jgi:Transcriptional regulators
MFPLLSPGPASDALIALARDHSAAEELQCQALLSLLDTSDAVRRALRQEVARHALTEPGFNVLAALLSRPAKTVATKDLAHCVGLTPHALETVLARLELSGLIARQPAASDRRVFAIQVTAAGRTAFSSAAAHCLAAIRDAMSSLSSGDLNALGRTCSTLRQLSSQTETHTPDLCAMSPSVAASSRETSSSSP